MTTDYLITIGLLVGVFSIPAMISAYAEARFPRAPMAAFLLAAAVITVAIILNPTRYSVMELPNVVVRVIADIIN